MATYPTGSAGGGGAAAAAAKQTSNEIRDTASNP